MIRVFIADDHPLLRRGLNMMLSDTEDIVVSGEASNGEEVLEKLEDNNCDVLVLDIVMPRKTGIEVLREIRAQGNNIPVLMLSTFAGEEFEKEALEAGAAGYITKAEAPEKLLEAIRKVHSERR